MQNYCGFRSYECHNSIKPNCFAQLLQAFCVVILIAHGVILTEAVMNVIFVTIITSTNIKNILQDSSIPLRAIVVAEDYPCFDIFMS